MTLQEMIDADIKRANEMAKLISNHSGPQGKGSKVEDAALLPASRGEA